jgi:hypothetical protein
MYNLNHFEWNQHDEWAKDSQRYPQFKKDNSDLGYKSKSESQIQPGAKKKAEWREIMAQREHFLKIL